MDVGEVREAPVALDRPHHRPKLARRRQRNPQLPSPRVPADKGSSRPLLRRPLLRRLRVEAVEGAGAEAFKDLPSQPEPTS